MFGRWSVESFADAIWIVPRFGGTDPPLGAIRLAPHEACRRITAPLSDGMLGRITLVDIIRHLEGHLVADGGHSTTWLLERLRVAMRDGRLAAYAVARSIGTRSGSGSSGTTDATRLADTSFQLLPQPGPPSIVTPTDFLVQWIDEIGVPIEGIATVFSVSGRSEPQVADGSGIARFTDESGSNFAFADPAALDGVREAVRGRWDTIRAGILVTEAEALLLPLRDAAASIPLQAGQIRVISVQPYVSRQRLIGGYFDTSKSFILPHGIRGVRAIVANYQDVPNAKLLIVGHTDLAGAPSINDPLSLERAESLKNYLTDNVDGWLHWYGSVPFEKRWGPKEDHLMLEALPDAGTRASNEAWATWFQRTRGLVVDGICGPKTRRQLVTEYMALDGTSLPSGIEPTMHGCGENFPDHATPDGAAAGGNRRVEVFFFDALLGIQPPPPGPNSAPGSAEYPEWVKRTRRTDDHIAHDGPQLLGLRLHDGTRAPMPSAAAIVAVGGTETPMGADGDGFIFVLLPAACPVQIKVSWGPAGTSVPFPFHYDVIAECNDGSAAGRDRNRLHNMGYPIDLPFDLAARAFQIDYEVDHLPQPAGLRGGLLPDASHALLAQIFEGECDASTSRPI